MHHRKRTQTPMPRQPSPSSIVRGTAAAIATLLCLLGSTALLARADRIHTPPPFPSNEPWVSAQGVSLLRAAIADYQRIVSAGGWPTLPNRIRLRLGDSDENVVTLRRRLAITGDLAARNASTTFDEEVDAAVRRYQMRNGLEPNGVVYGITQRSLNVPADTRLRQLQLNLARFEELLPRLAGARKYIIMNAASFELQGIEDQRVTVASRTIAGKRTTPTPVVSATVQAINILPYWHVPGTIAKAHLIPAMRKDPSYLYRERIRVFSTFGGEEIDPSQINWWGADAERYVFRQDPGPQNALGVLRFDMPNKHIVYMHDTPMKNLFGYFERAYSSGCVRMQNFLEVAEWVLGGHDGWSVATLRSAIAAGQGKTIKVPRPLPVHFIYLTSWVDNGAVQFRNDLYNRDASAFDGGEDVSARSFSGTLSP